MRRWGKVAGACGLVVALSLGLGAPAWGDGIDTPSHCPPGAGSDGCHADPGGFCSLNRTCTDDSSCPEGETCEEVVHCMVRTPCYATTEPREVTGICYTGEPCGGLCVPHQVCLDPSEYEAAGVVVAPPDGGADEELDRVERGCACRAGGRERPLRLAFGAVLALSLLVLVLVRARL